MTAAINAEALGRLREVLATADNFPDIESIISARDQVLGRYSPMFQPNAIGSIEEDTLRSFLYIENNMHWSGLYRHVNRVCADMHATRLALSALVDENQPIQSRLEPATEIKGMGKAIITAILHVAYPQKYGVWNNASESALVELGMFPDVPRGASFGERYAAINAVLTAAADALKVDLWTLDALWWIVVGESDGASTKKDSDASELVADPIDPSEPLVAREVRFALERHLQNFLLDNWNATSLGRDWQVFARPGEPDAGYEFPTQIGRIDLLARHRSDNRWLVIELKRDLSSDAAVGQVLRYIGWVEAELAEPGDAVEGLIIALSGDEKLHYAVKAAPRLSFMSYEVDFRLVPEPKVGGQGRP